MCFFFLHSLELDKKKGRYTVNIVQVQLKAFVLPHSLYRLTITFPSDPHPVLEIRDPAVDNQFKHKNQSLLYQSALYVEILFPESVTRPTRCHNPYLGIKFT